QTLLLVRYVGSWRLRRLLLWYGALPLAASGAESVALLGSVLSQRPLQAPSLASSPPQQPPALQPALPLVLSSARSLALARLVRSQRLLLTPSLASPRQRQSSLPPALPLIRRTLSTTHWWLELQ